ncbi:MAG TPA: dicarboxylate/amino acid:cation symporter [Kofleriaceae bacterium]|nr:dicarboxylate/amino acid:cation symporter [Kofleriaceae bacterium]
MGQRRVPLFVRVLIGVALGALVGIVFGKGDIAFGLTTADLGALGLLVVRMLRMLAVPLVLFAVLDALVRTEISARMGGRLIVICIFNVSVAFTIGLTIMNLLEPGTTWQGHIDELTAAVHGEGGKHGAASLSLSPLETIQRWVPEGVAQPFSDNNVIAVVLLALLAGIAIRRLRQEPEAAEPMAAVERVIDGSYRILARMLGYVIETVPFAVFGVVAQVVGKAGLDVFATLWVFVAVILLGMAIHALLYYPAAAWLLGGKPPRVYLGRGADAILTGLSTNSSLATVPITLRSLDQMGVTPESARLAACIGTNLNNDGITLYEAMAALFLAQALGYDLSIGAQITIVLASMMAGIGVAGVPEAGLIVLPLVLATAGLPETVVTALLPLVFAVDWILARCRSGVNVMADMLVAVLLDRWTRARGA